MGFCTQLHPCKGCTLTLSEGVDGTASKLPVLFVVKAASRRRHMLHGNIRYTAEVSRMRLRAARYSITVCGAHNLTRRCPFIEDPQRAFSSNTIQLTVQNRAG